MEYKTNDAVKREIRKQWEDACNAYLLELAYMWSLDCKSYGFWVGDKVGGMYAYGDNIFINMNEIIFCVENDVPKSVFDEYLEYCLWAHEFGFTVPNLMSFFKGCPIAPAEVRDKLSKQKRELDILIRKEREKLKNNGETNPF